MLNPSPRALPKMSTSLPLLLVVGVLVMAACVGDDPAVQGGSSGTVTGPDGGGGTTNDGAASGGDSATGTDSSTPSCACVDTGASLLCGATKTACGDYGCAEATAETAAHCRRFDPTGLVEPTDLIVAGLKDYTGKNLKFFTDTGQITTTDGATEIRAANAFPDKEEVNAAGIGFRLVAGKVGIFQFKNLTIEKADAFNFKGAVGSVALALVATEQITISGKLDLGCTTFGQLSGYPPAGSAVGGTSVITTVSGDGAGPGKGKGGGVAGGLAEGGGGGGGHSALGGGGADGFNTSVASGGLAGASYTDASFDPPLGGSGGGSGAMASGGAGGGAVQLVAGTKITIGSGTGAVAGAFGLAEGINVGGCGGASNLNGPSGGGGSGGTILIEAPVVVGLVNAGLATNGGSGGGGASDSQNGVISSSVQGPATNVCYGGGGNGGAGTSPSGGSGLTGTVNDACGGAKSYGGGGGGAAGIVRILTKSGSVTTDASFLISPSIAPALQKGKIATR